MLIGLRARDDPGDDLSGVFEIFYAVTPGVYVALDLANRCKAVVIK